MDGSGTGFVGDIRQGANDDFLPRRMRLLDHQGGFLWGASSADQLGSDIGQLLDGHVKHESSTDVSEGIPLRP